MSISKISTALKTISESMQDAIIELIKSNKNVIIMQCEEHCNWSFMLKLEDSVNIECVINLDFDVIESVHVNYIEYNCPISDMEIDLTKIYKELVIKTLIEL